MKNFALICKKLEKCIYAEEFSQKFQNPVMKMIFTMYGFLGGFCFDTLFNERFRKVWMTFNIFNFVVINLSCIFFCYDLKVKNFISLFMFLIPMIEIGGKIVVYLLTYLFRKKLLNLFENLNRKNEITKSFAWTGGFAEPRKNVNTKALIKTLSFLLTSFVILTLSYDFETLVTNLDDLTEKGYWIHYYPLYFPYERTTAVNLILRGLQLVTILPEVIVTIIIPIFFCACSAEIYNKYSCLRENLRYASHVTFQNVEKTYNSEMAMAEDKVPKSKTKYSELKIKRAHLLDEFLNSVIDCVKHHQKLHATTNLFISFVRHFISIAHVMTVLMLMTVGFLFTFKNLEKDGIYSIKRNKALIHCIPVAFLYAFPWLLFCNIGNQLEEMNEMIAEEIYASPWYHLAPKDRKIILNFLTLAQRFTGLYIWKICPVNLALFPETMNTIFSHIKILRTLQFRQN